jgi:hypothetical protein
MKKVLVSVLLTSLLFGFLSAQKPSLTLLADAGIWSGYFRFPDAYISRSRAHFHPAQIGVGLSWKITNRITFSPEFRIEYYGYRQDWSSKATRKIEAAIGLFYGSASPGLTFSPRKFFSVRAAFCMMTPFLTVGKYSMWYVDHSLNQLVTLNYTNHFSRIRNPFLGGPELSAGFNIPLEDQAVLGIRIMAFFGKNGIFQKDFDTPYNPRIHRYCLGLTYTFAST